MEWPLEDRVGIGAAAARRPERDRRAPSRLEAGHAGSGGSDSEASDGDPPRGRGGSRGGSAQRSRGRGRGVSGGATSSVSMIGSGTPDARSASAVAHATAAPATALEVAEQGGGHHSVPIPASLSDMTGTLIRRAINDTVVRSPLTYDQHGNPKFRDDTTYFDEMVFAFKSGNIDAQWGKRSEQRFDSAGISQYVSGAEEMRRMRTHRDAMPRREGYVAQSRRQQQKRVQLFNKHERGFRLELEAVTALRLFIRKATALRARDIQKRSTAATTSTAATARAAAAATVATAAGNTAFTAATTTEVAAAAPAPAVPTTADAPEMAVPPSPPTTRDNANVVPAAAATPTAVAIDTVSTAVLPDVCDTTTATFAAPTRAQIEHLRPDQLEEYGEYLTASTLLNLAHVNAQTEMHAALSYMMTMHASGDTPSKAHRKAIKKYTPKTTAVPTSTLHRKMRILVYRELLMWSASTRIPILRDELYADLAQLPGICAGMAKKTFAHNVPTAAHAWKESQLFEVVNAADSGDPIEISTTYPFEEDEEFLPTLYEKSYLLVPPREHNSSNAMPKWMNGKLTLNFTHAPITQLQLVLHSLLPANESAVKTISPANACARARVRLRRHVYMEDMDEVHRRVPHITPRVLPKAETHTPCLTRQIATTMRRRLSFLVPGELWSALLRTSLSTAWKNSIRSAGSPASG